MPITTSTTADRPAPRERLLAAADRLFYSDGICSVGVDRVLREADAARASLYTAFGSKEELVKAYLERRSRVWREHVEATLPRRWNTPRERVLGVFTMLGEWFVAPDYHGCPFINASAEARPGGAVEAVTDRHRAWIRDLFAGLASEAGADDPAAVSAQLILLYDGAMIGAQLDRSAAPAQAAAVAAAIVLDAAAP
jgi:AcrR family transcriptional regulator